MESCIKQVVVGLAERKNLDLLAERKNLDLLNTKRALMTQMNVPKRFWPQGVLTATYLINKLKFRV